ncbi:patatin-like phospholipase family protein [Microbulbifer epialgicus]|uniref:Patatin-like phospholipase family protein n=1 Tax=Microbulbifer epialgicus TaxID=393907 RepID=A0ABV4NV46_9GAMM
MHNTTLALALSGGGIRAMVFHAGVLLYLAEHSYLEKVSHISSVSGGSLLVGMVYKFNNYHWPDSESYKNHIFESVKAELCSRNLQMAALFEVLKPSNWPNLLSRANVLAEAISKIWGVDAFMGDLGGYPLWSINATTAETGRRFRFKYDTCGDYSIGYSNAASFRLSQAMAVSAAFPGGIGPLQLETRRLTWRKRRRWEDLEDMGEEVRLPYRKLHLYDGGVYDNLGMEPLFNPGNAQPKFEGVSVLVSDAGSPLPRGFSMFALNPFRLKRILDICMDQARSLRVRSFMEYLNTHNRGGGYLMIGQHPGELLDNDQQLPFDGQTVEDVRTVTAYKTDLAKIGSSDFDRIARHGYEVARAVDTLRGGLI